jgi:hypothetical protein
MPDLGPLFTPPSGPATAEAGARANSHAAYAAWRETGDGLKVWLAVEQRALDLYGAGARRISTKALVELARASLKLEINNTYTAWLADDLIRKHPQLRDVIERRARRKETT